MTDVELVSAFEAGRMPEGGFSHPEHVRVAWYYLTQSSLGDALTRFCRSLQRFAKAQGHPTLYHETITVAYLLLIHERMAAGPSNDWPAFAARHDDLLQWKPSILDRYYTPDTLWSERARQTFVMPDRLRTADDTAGPPQ
jgi:hypothetical protein